MQYYSKTLVLVSCLTVGLAGISFAAPEWTRQAGLDCWNYSAEKNRFDQSRKEAERLALVEERLHVKRSVSEHLAFGVCEDLFTVDAALDELALLAQDEPDWCPVLRIHLTTDVSQPLADRDLLALYLRRKIARMRDDALMCGDAARADSIRKRLDRFDEATVLPNVQ